MAVLGRQIHGIMLPPKKVVSDLSVKSGMPGDAMPPDHLLQVQISWGSLQSELLFGTL